MHKGKQWNEKHEQYIRIQACNEQTYVSLLVFIIVSIYNMRTEKLKRKKKKKKFKKRKTSERINTTVQLKAE